MLSRRIILLVFRPLSMPYRSMEKMNLVLSEDFEEQTHFLQQCLCWIFSVSKDISLRNGWSVLAS